MEDSFGGEINTCYRQESWETGGDSHLRRDTEIVDTSYQAEMENWVSNVAHAHAPLCSVFRTLSSSRYPTCIVCTIKNVDET